MNTEIIQTLTSTFEASAQQTEGGIEYWLARDLQHLLGYDEWRNFTAVIIKAKTACEVSGHRIADHFADVSKMVDLGSGSQREIEDIMLTRYACYLVASFSANGAFSNQPGATPQVRIANPTRAESPFHHTAMRHPLSHHVRRRTDEPRRWRSGICCAVHMGRCPMLVSNGPLALWPTSPRRLCQIQNLRRTRNLLLPHLLSSQVTL